MVNSTENVTKSALARLSEFRRMRRVRTLGTFGIVILGPVLLIATYIILGPLAEVSDSPSLRLILLADLIYILVLAALAFRQVAKIITARRAQSAGSRLHLRLTGVFAIVALIPTVLVAVFATITITLGLESWFSDRVSRALGNSFEAAQAYAQEQRDDLLTDAGALAGYLSRAQDVTRSRGRSLNDGELRPVLAEGQGLIQRGLSEAFVIDGTGEIRARGERSYLFDYEVPDDADLDRASAGELVLIEDWAGNEFRALLRLPNFTDRYLFISREVDGDILDLLSETEQTVLLYRELESERGQLLFRFGLLYLGFALIMIVAAVWLGMWFAERLARPVGRLASAAQRVGRGDLAVQVPEERGDDEIAMVGRLFNQMTRQLSAQRDELMDQNDRTERRRRLFDSVLGSVTSGVIGLDAEGRIDFMNRSARQLLGLENARDHGLALQAAVPEFTDSFERLTSRPGDVVQDEIKLTRKGLQESLLVRIATRRNEDGAREGFVVAFDDVSDLVSAQRMAAWGDVARRIAHEIKNPLTPISLSAERVQRKFRRKLDADDARSLEDLTGVIIRQTGDLRRIVDEFSKFARMPEPQTQPEDLVQLTRDAVLLQQAGQPGMAWDVALPDTPIAAAIDATLMGQALTNLLKNAGEATETLKERGAPEAYAPELRVALSVSEAGDQAVLRISDNGIGLPQDRSRLFEPYVTTRDAGTGLGLPIVKKIIEEHGGTLALLDADPFQTGAHKGAMAEITLPILIPSEERL